MAAIERLNGFRFKFIQEHLRNHTAAETATALRLDLARPDTIRRAIEAQGDPEWKIQLQQLLSLSQGARPQSR